MKSTQIDVVTGSQKTVVDLTSDAAAFCSDKGDGLLSVFVPHATAGLALFETGAGTEDDVLSAVDQLLPASPDRWRHRHGSPGHGRDHVLPAIISPSVTVPVSNGRMQLGTWQSLVLVDTNLDNPNRKVILSFLEG